MDRAASTSSAPVSRIQTLLRKCQTGKNQSNLRPVSCVPVAFSQTSKVLVECGKVQVTALYDATKFQKLKFADAAPVFISYKQGQVKPETMEMYDRYFRYLCVHFGEKRLCEITIADIQEYQHLRLEGKVIAPEKPWKSKRGRMPTHRAGASLINHEVNALTQVLDKAEQWNRLRQWYTPVPEQVPKRPKTMTIAAEEEFLRVANSTPDWLVACLVAVLTNNTGAAGIEIRSLRLMDIDLQGSPPKFQVYRGKNKIREGRPIPLNDTAYSVMAQMVQRAVNLGARNPEHFLFPFRVKRNCYDPTRHASKSWLKHQWKMLTAAAGVPWLHPHNLRFQCATRMRAMGVPGETIKNQFGWKNLKMLELYDQPQIDILYEWVMRIDSAAAKHPARSEIVPQWIPKTKPGFPHNPRTTQ